MNTTQPTTPVDTGDSDELWDAKEWFRREAGFAIDAKDFPLRLVNVVEDPIIRAEVALATAYRNAAQAIACTRHACGGPNSAHNHQPLQEETTS